MSVSEDLRRPVRPQARRGKVVLRLYVAGSTPRSSRAITNLKSICETNLKGSYELTVTDLYEQNARALDDRIMVAPTLIRKLPLPECRVLGDLSQTGRVLAALGLPPAPHHP
jgi:circadian clock protein KaiB